MRKKRFQFPDCFFTPLQMVIGIGFLLVPFVASVEPPYNTLPNGIELNSFCLGIPFGIGFFVVCQGLQTLVFDPLLNLIIKPKMSDKELFVKIDELLSCFNNPEYRKKVDDYLTKLSAQANKNITL